MDAGFYDRRFRNVLHSAVLFGDRAKAMHSHLTIHIRVPAHTVSDDQVVAEVAKSQGDENPEKKAAQDWNHDARVYQALTLTRKEGTPGGAQR